MYCKCGCGKKTTIPYRNRYELGHKKGVPLDYLIGHKYRGLTGKKHWNWKGDIVGYKAFHLRVNKIRGKATMCDKCGSTYYVEWASLTGNYQDPWDFRSLCRKCHHKFDDIQNKGWKTRRGVGNSI